MAAALFLFTPAHDLRKVTSAFRSGAESLVLDLEDSVPDANKAEARASISRLDQFKQANQSIEVWIRINGGGHDFDADLAAIDWSSVTGAVLPKAEDVSQVESLARAGVRRAILLVESAAGLHAVERLTGASAITERLAIGTWDLALDLGLFAIAQPDDSELLWQLRGQMVVDSRRLGLDPPIDGIFDDIIDESGFRESCSRAHRLGFGGKLLVHPRQIEIARSIFAADPAAVQQAREIVDAYNRAVAQGHGALSLNGRLVDRPMVQRAKALLARARL